MALQCISTILCERVHEEGNGVISLLNVFDDLAPATFPALYLHMALVTVWTGCAGDFVLCTRVIGPDGKDIAERQVAPFALAAPESRFRSVLNIMNLVFPVPGRYVFQSLIDGEPVLEYPLYLVKRIAKVAVAGTVPVFSKN